MGCINCSDSSSTTYSRCNPTVSSNCVLYQGTTLTCPSDNTFTVCKGDVMSEVQETLFNKICQLNGNIDVKEIRFPCSLQDAWNLQDKTILNLLSYLAELSCTQKTAIESLGAQIQNINPVVDICLQCCGDECGSTELLLSDALNKIVECLCATKTQVASLQLEVNLISAGYNGLQSQLDLLKTFQTAQLALNIDLQTRLLAAEAKIACLPDC